MAVRKRTRKTTTKKFPKRKAPHRAPESMLFGIEDVKLWAKSTGRPMFTEALKEANSLRCPVNFIWRKGAKELQVVPKEQNRAVRKRVRK